MHSGAQGKGLPARPDWQLPEGRKGENSEGTGNLQPLPSFHQVKSHRGEAGNIFNSRSPLAQTLSRPSHCPEIRQSLAAEAGVGMSPVPQGYRTHLRRRSQEHAKEPGAGSSSPLRGRAGTDTRHSAASKACWHLRRGRATLARTPCAGWPWPLLEELEASGARRDKGSPKPTASSPGDHTHPGPVPRGVPVSGREDYSSRSPLFYKKTPGIQ